MSKNALVPLELTSRLRIANERRNEKRPEATGSGPRRLTGLIAPRGRAITAGAGTTASAGRAALCPGRAPASS